MERPTLYFLLGCRWSLGHNAQKDFGTFSCGFCASKTVIQERNAYIDARVKKFMEFGTRYAAAWSSQDPARLAAFYAENGSLTVNDGAPSVGRAAITETARRFMTAFPDMVVKMTVTRGGEDYAIFLLHVDRDEHKSCWHWPVRRFTGTKT